MDSNTKPATRSATTRAAAHRPSTRLKLVALWGLRVALGAFFVMSGSSKLAGAADMIALFDEIGLGHGLRFLTGGIETAAAVMLLIPRLTAVGAAALAAVMAGATLTHIFILQQSPLLPATLFAVAGILLLLQRERTVAVTNPPQQRTEASRTG